VLENKFKIRKKRKSLYETIEEKMIKETSNLKEILKNAKVCVPDNEGNLYCWFGEGSVTAIDPETGDDVDYFSVSPWFTAKPSMNNVISYILRRIKDKC